MTKFYLLAILSGSLLLSSSAWAQQNSPRQELPAFEEVYQLIRTHMKDATERELNRAAVAGLLEQLPGRVTLLTNQPSSGAEKGSFLSKSTVYEEAFAFLRVGQVEADLAKQIRSAYDHLRSQNQLKGLILDLRFAEGDNYLAAAEVVDLFLSSSQPLFKSGETLFRSSAKTNAIPLNVVALVNSKTSGAAEILAAALRLTGQGLVIGGRTAGQAHYFRDFPVGNDQMLKIAVGSVLTPDGAVLAENGLVPDISVPISPEDEKAYFEDPYLALPKPLVQAISTNGLNQAGLTSGPRRRINESELIRMRREGIDPELESMIPATSETSKPVLQDPALARAVDFLKGLALVQNRR